MCKVSARCPDDCFLCPGPSSRGEDTDPGLGDRSSPAVRGRLTGSCLRRRPFDARSRDAGGCGGASPALKTAPVRSPRGPALPCRQGERPFVPRSPTALRGHGHEAAAGRRGRALTAVGIVCRGHRAGTQPLLHGGRNAGSQRTSGAGSRAGAESDGPGGMGREGRAAPADREGVSVDTETQARWGQFRSAWGQPPGPGEAARALRSAAPGSGPPLAPPTGAS